MRRSLFAVLLVIVLAIALACGKAVPCEPPFHPTGSPEACVK